jgi:hypothetical protein
MAGPSKSNGGNNSDPNAAPKGDAPAMVVPFVRASDEHLQPGNLDRTVTAGSFATATDLGITDIPAYGYISHLYIKVTATGGAAGLATVAASEDAPFNVLQNIALTEPNGAVIVQFNSGYEMYLANKYGGYVNPVSSDPKNSPVFSDVATSGNFTFLLRVPVCLSVRDAVGALANQDSAGQFKFRCTVAASSTVYSTAPNTLPAVRVQAWLAAYDQPEPSSAGVGNQVEPPASGTTSFWTVQSGITVANGQNTIELKRKGNYLRQIIFVLRTSGSRSTADTDWPVETRFLRDSFPARYYDDGVWRHKMFELTGYTGTLDNPGAPEAGVRFHDYMHEWDGALGRELRDLWQPTRGSTRLEIDGSFQAAATLDIITNDVAVANNVFV